MIAALLRAACATFQLRCPVTADPCRCWPHTHLPAGPGDPRCAQTRLQTSALGCNCSATPPSPKTLSVLFITVPPRLPLRTHHGKSPLSFRTLCQITHQEEVPALEAPNAIGIRRRTRIRHRSCMRQKLTALRWFSNDTSCTRYNRPLEWTRSNIHPLRVRPQSSTPASRRPESHQRKEPYTHNGLHP